MPDPARRQIDFTRLPTGARYALAVVILVAVVGIALAVHGSTRNAKPAGWYTVVITVGAILLIGYVVVWLLLRVLKLRDRH